MFPVGSKRSKTIGEIVAKIIRFLDTNWQKIVDRKSNKNNKIKNLEKKLKTKQKRFRTNKQRKKFYENLCIKLGISKSGGAPDDVPDI